MAGENLGTATLVLDVDSRNFDRALQKLRQDIDKFKVGDLKIDLKGAPQVQKELKNISTEADRATVKARSLAQILNDPVGGSYSKLSAQISGLTTKSRELSLSSQDYLQVLEKISRLELIRSSKTGRARVEADFEAQKTLIAAERAPNAVPRKGLPNTTAADLQRLAELSERLLNVDKSSANYELTLRQIEAIQRRVTEANNGVSASLKQLQVQQDGAARRAEKLASIQDYYASKTPAAGGIRDASGAMIARGAGSRADEKAYNDAIRPAKQLLETDLRRAQVIREISQRMKAAADTSGGFGDFSKGLGGDPVSKAIRRNAERTASREAAQAAKREALEADLSRVRELRLKTEKEKLAADKAEADALKATAKEATAAKQDRTRRRKDAIGSAIIGGAFPALFGQGLGASVGGAFGGGVGGAVGGQFGFGLSLVGTAVGAQFDTLLQKGLALAQSLDDPIKNFEQLADAAVLSSKQLESYVRGLIESGRGAEAQVLIQKDLFDTFGSLQGVKDYQNSIDGLNRSWARAGTIIADFVSGPLAKLLQGFTNTNDNVGTAVRYEQLVGQLTPEQYNRVQAVRDSATRQSAAASGRPGFLPPSENNVAAGRQAAIREAERLLGVDKQRAEIAAQLAAAQLRNKESISTNYRLIDAQTQGYEKQTLELQIQEALNERNRRLLELPADKRVGSPEALRIQQDTALKVYESTQRITELDEQRWANNIAAANRLKDIQEQTSIEASRPSLSGTGIGALQSIAQFNAAKRAEQNAQAQLRTKPGDPDLLNAAAEASAKVKLAAAKTRSDLKEAYQAAEDSVRNISRSIQDATTALNAAQGSDQGVNKYISAQERYDRQTAANARLFSEAQNAARALGVTATFAGTLTERNSQLTEFIQSAKAELRAPEDIARSQVDLYKSTNDLVVIQQKLLEMSSSLSKNIADLANKDWTVNVSVNKGGAVAGPKYNPTF